MTIQQKCITPTLLLTFWWNVYSMSVQFLDSSHLSQLLKLFAIQPFRKHHFFCLAVLQFHTVPLQTCSLMKWYFMAMCLLLPWNCGFFAMLIAAWLYIIVAPTGPLFRAVVSRRIQIASCAAAASATYSASAVDNATHACLLLSQLTAVPQIWNM